MADKTIVVRLIAQTGGYQAEMAAAAASTNTFSQSVTRSTARAGTQVSRFGKIASSIGKVATIGIAAGLALSAKAAIDFESSFAGVRKTVEATEPQFRALKDAILGLSTRIPVNANELNRIAELGGQLGVSVGGLLKFTETIAKLGVTTNLSTETAALGLARLDNILQLGGKSFERLGSAIVDLGNNFATTEDEILNFALRVAPVGKSIGLSADNVLAIAAAFSSAGVAAERGGTAIQRTFIKIADSVESGGRKLNTFAAVAGLTADEFQKLFREDSATAFRLFVEGLGRVQKAGGNVFAVLRDVDLGNQRTVQSLLAVANAGNLLERALEGGEEAFEANIALTEEAEKRFETTASKMELAKNQFNALRVELGEKLLPVIGNLADAMSAMLFGFRNLSPEVRRFLTILAAVVTGLTITQVISNKLVTVFGTILPAAFKATTAAAGLMRLTIVGLALAVGAFAVGKLIEYGQTQQDIRLQTESLTAVIKENIGAWEENTVAQIKNQLVAEGRVDLFNRLGIGLDDVARAATGDTSALARVTGRLNEVRDALGPVVNRSEDYVDSLLAQTDGAVNAQEAFTETYKAQEAAAGPLGDLREAYEILGLHTDITTASLARARKEITAEQTNLLIQKLGVNYRFASQEAIDMALSSGEVADALVGDLNPALEETIDFSKQAGDAVAAFGDVLADGFEEIEEEILGAIDPWEEYSGAVRINLAKARTSFMKQLAAVELFQKFKSALRGAGVSEQSIARFDELDLGQQQFVAESFFGAQKKQDQTDLHALILLWEEGNLTLADLIRTGYKEKLPELLKEGGDAMLAELEASAAKILADPDNTLNPIEVWEELLFDTIEAADSAGLSREVDEYLLAAMEPGEALAFLKGTAIGDGLLMGIAARLAEGIGTVEAGVRSVVGRMGAAALVESPSKLSMRIGEFIGEGLILGIGNSLRNFDASRLIGAGIDVTRSAAVDTSAAAFSTGSTTTNSFDLSVSGSQDPARDGEALLLLAQLTAK